MALLAGSDSLPVGLTEASRGPESLNAFQRQWFSSDSIHGVIDSALQAWAGQGVIVEVESEIAYGFTYSQHRATK